LRKWNVQINTSNSPNHQESKIQNPESRIQNPNVESFQKIENGNGNWKLDWENGKRENAMFACLP